MIDQAAALRNLVLRTSPRPDDGRQCAARLVVLMGGKGGVGVTTLAVNLSIALVAQEYRVVLVDADLYRADVALMCRLHERHTIADVLSERQRILDVVQPGPGGIQIVPGVWAPNRQMTFDHRTRQRLIGPLRQLGTVADIVLLDVGSAGAEVVHDLWPAVHDALLVTTPDAVAIMDCYATIKTAVGACRSTTETPGRQLFATPTAGRAARHDTAVGSNSETDGNDAPDMWLITNQVTSDHQGGDVHGRIDHSVQRFLGLSVGNAGAVPHEAAFQQAAGTGQPLLLANPAAPAAQAVRQIAAHLANQWRHPRRPEQTKTA